MLIPIDTVDLMSEPYHEAYHKPYHGSPDIHRYLVCHGSMLMLCVNDVCLR